MATFVEVCNVVSSVREPEEVMVFDKDAIGDAVRIVGNRVPDAVAVASEADTVVEAILVLVTVVSLVQEALVGSVTVPNDDDKVGTCVPVHTCIR